MIRYPYTASRQPAFIPSLCGPLELVTPPSSSVIAIDRRNQAASLDMVKLHLRVAQEMDNEDDIITQHVQAATRYCESLIDGERTFLTTVWDMPVSFWWFSQSSFSTWASPEVGGGRANVINGCGEQLPIPRPPLQSVTWVKYYDPNGTQQTLASTYYLVRTPRRQEGTIERAPLQVFPALAVDRQFPITIRFSAGYGDGVTTFPPVEVQQAILLITAEFYQNREPSEKTLDRVESLLRSVSYGSYA